MINRQVAPSQINLGKGHFLPFTSVLHCVATASASENTFITMDDERLVLTQVQYRFTINELTTSFHSLMQRAILDVHGNIWIWSVLQVYVHTEMYGYFISGLIFWFIKLCAGRMITDDEGKCFFLWQRHVCPPSFQEIQQQEASTHPSCSITHCSV